MAALGPCLALQQAPSLWSCASCPALHWDGGLWWLEEPVFPWEITAQVDSPHQPNTLAAHGHLCKYLNSLLYLGSVQKHDKAGKGSRHRQRRGQQHSPGHMKRGGFV